ncbi:General stress protein 16O [Roseimaritima multifibrata]|uniref:General stress protein 16O n=1 Tax=Roseimaritima multifibrata TaxID=1930274 RepID=A0A517MGR4_9BACT|nr:TraR/DksA family transcriptional regulator [Roseimaritima multifibrata]QDS94073.1 General stress protein 16O [Roseimaritima multifibrata]
MPNKDAVKKLREVLVLRRDALQRALAGDLSLLREVRNSGSGDLLDAAVDTAQSEVNSQLAEVESRELSLIDSALERMEQGVYGACEECGKAIPLTRLRAVPYATECIACRRKSEQGTSAAPAWNRLFADAPAETLDR